jgi:hypothetical protein
MDMMLCILVVTRAQSGSKKEGGGNLRWSACENYAFFSGAIYFQLV